MKKNKKILICPLDWGLGHASRCIPVITALREKGIEVVIGADQRPLALLRAVFPELEHIRLPGYTIRYPGKGSMEWRILRSLPGILSGIRKEHRLLAELVQVHQFDAIISDNRLGLWHKQVPCIYMTHQVMVKVPGALSFLEPVLYSIHKNIMKKYSACWIPDYPGENNLSGDLGHKFKAPLKTFFIGPLSRFAVPDGTSEGDHDNYKSDILAIISGPEPQRTILEQLILSQLKGSELKATVLLGLPEKQIAYQLDDHIRVFSNLDTPTFRKYILGAQHIICRPGYSGIMDLFALGRKAILIPTPGQTEQEYLAAHLSRYQFVCKKQDHFLLRDAILENSEKTWHNSIDDDVLLDQALVQLIDNI